MPKNKDIRKNRSMAIPSPYRSPHRPKPADDGGDGSGLRRSRWPDRISPGRLSRGLSWTKPCTQWTQIAHLLPGGCPSLPG